MSISIAEIRTANTDEWDTIWWNCNYSTYFHSREWAEIWMSYTNGKMHPKPLSLTFSDGKKALLPLSVQTGKLGIFKTYFSSPAGTFGGWISEDKLYIEHASLIIDFLKRKASNLVWRLNPYDPLSSVLDLRKSINDETQTLNLSKGFDNICRKWSKGHISAANKAHKEGVIVKIASTLNDWKEYYQVYENSLKRWGEKATSSYDWKLFDEMFNRNSRHIKLWSAIFQDKMIAGALCFYAKNHMVYWHGSALYSFFHLRPVNKLIYEIIKDSCENKYSWFDFNPSGGHEGVRAFKKSFGAETLACPVICFESKFVRTFKIMKNFCSRKFLKGEKINRKS